MRSKGVNTPAAHDPQYQERANMAGGEIGTGVMAKGAPAKKRGAPYG